LHTSRLEDQPKTDTDTLDVFPLDQRPPGASPRGQKRKSGHGGESDEGACKYRQADRTRGAREENQSRPVQSSPIQPSQVEPKQEEQKGGKPG
jgi:hypothetical protein